MTNTFLNISSGPHVRDRLSTKLIMVCVLLALLPAAVVGVVVYGTHALLIILASVGTAVLSEYLFDLLVHKDPKGCLDGSAALTGLLLALSLSPSTPLYAPILGAIFAIVVVKGCFGGLGKNFLNPALAARCFLLISFSNPMTAFKVDAVTSATPVAELLAGRAVNITSMFLGTSNAVIGSSILALLIGGLLLWAFDIIHGEICFSVLGAFTLFVALFGGQGFDPAFLVANICGGGIVMGAFFMATDYVTSPVSKKGQIIYGAVIGILAGLFRVYGSSADSVSYSILIGNLLTPMIDMYVVPKPFAYTKKEVSKRNGEPKKTFKDFVPRPVIVIAIITLIAGVALGGTYKMTEETISIQKEKKAWASYQAVVPGAVEFKQVEAVNEIAGQIYGTEFGRVKINQAVEGLDESGNTVGYAIEATSSEGYEGNITLSIGISANGTINSISFTELNETPGKGMFASEPEFKDQFNGMAATKLKLVKSGKSASNEVDSISGATITSNAVVNAVNAALDFYNNTIKGE